MADNKNLIALMAESYHLEPDEFVRTVKATCGLVKCTPEEFLTFLWVAKQYNLDPLVRDIYAFPKPGGGIQIIVGYDGWDKVMNRHPMHKSIDFVYNRSAGGGLVSVTCKIMRRDRDLPIVVTESLQENRRNTDPWRNMPERMLRNRSLAQGVRMAYGLGGVMSEDEAEAYLERLKAQPTNVVDVTNTPLDQIADSLPDGTSDAVEIVRNRYPEAVAEAAEEIPPQLHREPGPPPEPEPEPLIDENQREMIESAVVMGGWPVKAISEVVLVHAGCKLTEIKVADFLRVMNSILEGGKKRKAAQAKEKLELK